MNYFESILLPKLKTTDFFPEGRFIFRAFNECSYEDTKVVLIGQDPYHDGSATGLCFDNIFDRKKTSPSLLNILKELHSDVGPVPEDINNKTSDLEHLPSQGVLMLNTALSVEEGKAGSHTALWKPFMDEVFQCLNQKDNIVWIMLGNHAKSYKSIITNPTHRFIEAVHPSPLSASRGFFGSKIFSRTNQALEELGLSPINW